MGCWTCGGPHLAKSCPNRERVNVMLAGNVNQGEGEQEVVAALANPLGWSLNQFSLLNVVGDSPKSFNPHSTLIHIEMKVDGNDGMMIMNEVNPSFIKVVHFYGEAKKVKNKTLIISAISNEKGLKKGDETFLAAMIEVKPDVKVEVPDCVAQVLK
ncbi:hypothetical protein FXO38_36819 [Capsicum annuum]|nr:hypothetical protein FXO38_36819 [Capsicum annuum]